MNTREEISRYLENHPYSCAEELATVLGKTRANIQHHLKALEQAKIISQVSIAKPHPVRGRPRAYYSLTPVKRPNNLFSLADALLHLALDNANEDTSTFVLAEIANQIVHPAGADSTLTQRLNRTVKQLTHLGYQARWEAHAEGPQVVFRNCPYHPLPGKYPTLCRMDALLLAQNLGISEPIQTAQIQLPIINACRFILKES